MSEVDLKLVLATRNRGKISEIKGILSDLDIEILSAGDFESFPDPEETGKTFLENALIKARAVYRKTQVTALADDSGIEVDFLGGGPGVRSARYGGEGLDDSERYIKLLEELKGVPESERGARFRCVMALYPLRGGSSGCGENDFSEDILSHIEKIEEDRPEDPLKGGKEPPAGAFVTEGFLYGRISEKPAGESGFGYDPVFYIPEEGRTAAQMSRKEKNRISHRYRALVEMKSLLQHCFGLKKRDL
ncbi:MAG TPA: non-canonical purine NTP pyrophosphatase [Candidatus Krumholzibacteriaceae bacterium]|nr:non-canonical purine NTP pyrophosphatase [Candidatus Krumholzibacteriaceae bacterium]